MAPLESAMAAEPMSVAISQWSPTVEARNATPPARLEVGVRREWRPRVRVVLTGELDDGSATLARQVFAAAVNEGYTEVEVDVSGLSFIDVAGLDVFECAQRDCAEHGGLLVLLDVPPMLRRVLNVTGLGWLTNYCRN